MERKRNTYRLKIYREIVARCVLQILSVPRYLPFPCPRTRNLEIITTDGNLIKKRHSFDVFCFRICSLHLLRRTDVNEPYVTAKEAKRDGLEVIKNRYLGTK